jgi:hypothetical protein
MAHIERGEGEAYHHLQHFARVIKRCKENNVLIAKPLDALDKDVGESIREYTPFHLHCRWSARFLQHMKITERKFAAVVANRFREALPSLAEARAASNPRLFAKQNEFHFFPV